MNGKVMWVSPKGYGFIESDGGELVYADSRLLDGLATGQTVFVEDAEKNHQGMRAVKISIPQTVCVQTTPCQA